jgi:leader peptidase (prepilin peptidase) / N-methyltransferase
MGCVLGSGVNSAYAWTRRRPLAGALALALAAVVAARYGPGAGGVIAGCATAVLVVLASIDVGERRLPNAIVLPAAAAVLSARLATEPGHWHVWLAATFAPALGFLILALVYPAGLGMGDVKLTLLIGATLGADVLAGLLAGTFATAAAGIFLLVRHGTAARRRALPFGPFLAFGTILVLLAATPGQ